jgi:hypothetical protein
MFIYEGKSKFIAPPNGCKWCGYLPENHGRRALNTPEIHLWTAPSDSQRKERLLQRRSNKSLQQS